MGKILTTQEDFDQCVIESIKEVAENQQINEDSIMGDVALGYHELIVVVMAVETELDLHINSCGLNNTQNFNGMTVTEFSNFLKQYIQ